MLVPGKFVVSDVSRDSDGSDFAAEVLGVELDSVSDRNRCGRVRMAASTGAGGSYSYSNTLNDKNYIVEKPDALHEAWPDSKTVMTLSDSEAAAGIFSRKGKSRRAVFSIPFESITDKADRAALMKAVMEYFEGR